jgi:hypothetical protein
VLALVMLQCRSVEVPFRSEVFPCDLGELQGVRVLRGSSAVLGSGCTMGH